MNSYSCANNYIYQDKPQLNTAVDWILSPIRIIFEGRTINLLNGVEKIPSKFSPEIKVASALSILAMSILFPLLGATLATVLVFKAGCCFWEQKKVNVELSEVTRVMQEFQKSYRTGNYAEAILAIETRPQLAFHWKNELLSMEQKLVKKIDQTESLRKLCQIYSTNNESIELFHHIVKTKFEKNMLNFDLNHIEGLIKNLKILDQEAVIYCHSIMDIFQPLESDPFLTKMIKINTGMGIINLFKDYSRSEFINKSKDAAEPLFLANYRLPGNAINNFNGVIFYELLIDKIQENRQTYIQLITHFSDWEHLAYLIEAFKEVKALENEINQILPQLDSKHFNPQDAIVNLQYKKKIIAYAKRFLEDINKIHQKDTDQQKYLSKCDKELISFVLAKQKNIDSNYKFNTACLNLAEQLLIQSEHTLKFNTSKYKSSIKLLRDKIFGELGELYFPPNVNHIHDLYKEYYQLLRNQFCFVDKVLELVSLFGDLSLEQQ